MFRLAPSFLLECAPVEIVTAGSNFSAEQSATWKGSETGETMPSQPPTVPVMLIGSQLVGLIVKFGRLTVTLTCLISTGMPSLGLEPSTILGIVPVVTVTWAVEGFISIFALVTTGAPCCRINGPAFAGVTIDRPNGAPS